jgi:hydrogenase maturation protease
MTAAVRILACGAGDRRDDGVALRAVCDLPADLLPRTTVERVGQLSAEQLVGDAPGVVRIVVDCVRGLAAGAIIDLPLSDLPRLEAAGSVTSTHALPIGQAVALAAAVGAVRPGDRFIGIGGASFGEGTELTPPVAAAVSPARQVVTDQVRRVLSLSTNPR